MRRQSFWNHRFTRTRIKSEKVQLPEMLFGYILGPMGASISGSIFGSILQSYFTDVLRLDLRFLSRLQLVSTVLIVAANLLVGQLIEHTRATAGKARPWLLLSVFTFSSASVLMFIVPFQGVARMVWIAVAYNLYYSFASPIYSTASSIMISVSTRDSRQRGLLASINSMVGLGVMGTCSMVFPMLVSFFLRENIHRWFFTMLGVAVFTGLTIYLQFAFTRERVTEERRILEGLYGPEDEFEAARQTETPPPEPVPVQRVSLRRQLRAVAADPMWWLILGVCVLFQWSGSLKNSTMTYYCKWVVDNTFLGSAGAWGASSIPADHDGCAAHGAGLGAAGAADRPVRQAQGVRLVSAAGRCGRRTRGAGAGQTGPCCHWCCAQVLRLCAYLLSAPCHGDRCGGPCGGAQRHPYGRTYHVGVQLPVRGGRLGDECTVQRGAGAHRL